jgi:hypothetical protein
LQCTPFGDKPADQPQGLPETGRKLQGAGVCNRVCT